jgi:hypothetical protein
MSMPGMIRNLLLAINLSLQYRSTLWSRPYRVTPRANSRLFRRKLLYQTLLELKGGAYER